MTNEQKSRVMQTALANRARIWGFLMGLTKDPSRAEDLFQSTYLVICEKWEQYREGSNFLAWALQIARYEFLASVDPARKRLVTVEAEVLECALQAASERSGPHEIKLEALRRCVEKLKGRARQAIQHRYADGLAYETIAERLSVTLNALYSLLSRVRVALRECVEREMHTARTES